MRSGGIVLGVSLGVLAGGVALITVAASADDISTAGTRFLGGTLLILGGVVGTGIGATTLGSANQELQELRELQQASYSQPRRVQWDLAQSRLVF